MGGRRERFQSDRSRVLEVALGMFGIPDFSYYQIDEHLDISYQLAYRAVNQLESGGRRGGHGSTTKQGVLCRRGARRPRGGADPEHSAVAAVETRPGW